MKRALHPFILLSFLLSFFFITTTTHAFDRGSFSRQQSQADKGFDDLDAEFEEPAPPPKVITKEKIIVKEKKVLVPVPVPVPPIAVIPTPVPYESNAAVRTKTANGNLFTLKGCTLSGRNIECNLTVVREKDDGHISLRTGVDPKTSLFDKTGNQYHPHVISLGSTRSNWARVTSRLIQGIISKVKIHFSDVASETSSIALLELQGHDGNSGQHFNVQFRNVAFQQ